jgi:glucosamine-6-phosphate deaminase
VSEVIVLRDADEAGAFAAGIVAQLVADKPTAVLGIATGSTPLAVYRRLADLDVDFSGVSAFALDEYVGLPHGHPESYRAVIQREVVVPLGLDPLRVHVPNGDTASISRAGADYEIEIVAAGGVDLQILGIGTDGHIGFNEPGSSLASLTRVKTLAPQTRSDNARFFNSLSDVPVHCVTQGVGTILRAQHLVLLAFGAAKAQALAAAVEGPITSSVPASAIQMHAHVTVIVDEEAARELKHADYYRYIFENRRALRSYATH